MTLDQVRKIVGKDEHRENMIAFAVTCSNAEVRLRAQMELMRLSDIEADEARQAKP